MKKRNIAISCLLVLLMLGFTVEPEISAAAKGARKKTVTSSKKAKSKSLQKAEKKAEIDDSRKVVLGIDLGYMMPLMDLGEIVEPQVSGRIFFQYQDLVWWLGVGADVGFTQFADKDYDGRVNMAYILARPLLTFPLGMGFDMQITAGVGVAIIKAQLEERSSELDALTVDPVIDAGMNIMYNFLGRYAVGVEGRYYHLFEDKSYNAVEASVFLAVKF